MSTLFLLAFILNSFNKKSRENHPCETLNDIFETGKQLWQQQNYIESYRIFFELGETYLFQPSVCARYQIQCLMQLQQWRHALQTCHLQIKRQPQVEEWYLLASDIYMQQRDYTLSWEILHQALLISPEIALRKRIAYEATIQQQWGASMIQRRDILEKIPYDVATLIFYFLDLASLVKCTRVSTRWRHFLVNNPQLWNELEFEKKTTIKTMDAYLRRLGRAPLSRLVIRHQHTDGDRIFLTLAERQCLKLKQLVISGVICTPALFFNALEYMGSTLNILQWGGVSIRLNELVDILSKYCFQLKHLKLHDCFTSLYDLPVHNGNRHHLEVFGESLPTDYIRAIEALPRLESLQSLELSGIHGLNSDHLANILFRCPDLKSLTLERCLVDIIPVINILEKSCPKLQHLFYDRNQYCRQYDLYQQQRYLNNEELVQTNKRVTPPRKYPWIELKIHLTHMLSDTVIQYLMEGSRSSLELLDLRGNTMITDKGILDPETPMRRLKTLCLKDCTGITTKGLIQLIVQSPLLETIDLSELSVVNDDVFKQLSQCQYLHTLNLSKCALSVTNTVYKEFINTKKDTLKKLVLESTKISFELLCYSMRKLKTGIL